MAFPSVLFPLLLEFLFAVEYNIVLALGKTRRAVVTRRSDTTKRFFKRFDKYRRARIFPLSDRGRRASLIRDGAARSAIMSNMDSVGIVEQFWAAVWKARDPEAIDRFVVDDFVLTTGGVDVVTKAAFKTWAAQFMEKINNLEFEAVETFQNEDGSRVASRWRLTGENNGLFGTAADQRPIELTGTAVWAVREDGKLLHNWVERSSWELFQRLTEK